MRKSKRKTIVYGNVGVVF